MKGLPLHTYFLNSSSSLICGDFFTIILIKFSLSAGEIMTLLDFPNLISILSNEQAGEDKGLCALLISDHLPRSFFIKIRAEYLIPISLLSPDSSMGSKMVAESKKGIRPNCLTPCFFWRRHPDLNRRITVLQTVALPLGYAALGAGNGI